MLFFNYISSICLRYISTKKRQVKVVVSALLGLTVFQLLLLIWTHEKKPARFEITWTISKNTSKNISAPSQRLVVPKNILSYGKIGKTKNTNLFVHASRTMKASGSTVVDSVTQQTHRSNAKFILVIPHRVKNISLGYLKILEENDRNSVEFLAEMLNSIDDLDGATCVSQTVLTETIKTLSSNKYLDPPWRNIFGNSSCNFSRRDWSIQIRNTGIIKMLNYTVSSSHELLHSTIIFQLCNIINGPFILKKHKFIEIGNLNPNLGRLSILDFFLRSKARLKIGKFGNCTFSDQLLYSDRAALEGSGDFPEYSDFGTKHGILRIIKEDRIEWTTCAASARLCKEKPYVAPNTLPQVGQPVCCSVVLGKMLKAITDVFVKLGIKHRVVYGTLLGAIRNKAIIPWTHDIDVSLERHNTNNKTFYAIVQPYLKDRYYIGRSFMGMARAIPLMPPHINVKTTSFFDGDSDLQGDKFFSPAIRESVQELLPFTGNNWRTRGYMDFYTAPEVWWKDMGIIEINGDSYITVKDIDKELQLWYGKTYMKPALQNNWRGLSDQGAVDG